jgi:hypothetical protein
MAGTMDKIGFAVWRLFSQICLASICILLQKPQLLSADISHPQREQ